MRLPLWQGVRGAGVGRKRGFRYGEFRMRHFFILGTNPVLSTAEIIALLDGRQFTVTEMYKQALIVDAMPGATLDAPALMRRLGGTIKIGTIVAEDLAVDEQALSEQMLQGLSHRVGDVGSATFGFSVYSLESEA